MASLKGLRNRIAGVKSTMTITSAMKMVAATKLRRAEESARSARPYAERMQDVLRDLAAGAGDSDGGPRLLVGTGADETHLLVVATAERGLCGAFNSSIVRHAREHADDLIREGKTLKILCVGKKGRDQLQRLYGRYIEDTILLEGVRNVEFTHAAQISERVMDMFDTGEFDICTLFFSQYRTVMSQVPTAQQLIPAFLEVEGEEEVAPGERAYEYEPDEAEILEALLPRNLTVQIFHALLENAASEQGARMTAMDSATRNAGEMIDRLTLNYNRSRQAQITTELIEIISGAEAL